MDDFWQTVLVAGGILGAALLVARVMKPKPVQPVAGIGGCAPCMAAATRARHGSWGY